MATVEEDVQKIIRQTDYTEETAREKMKEFNNDYMSVIRDYLGITQKKQSVIKSVNQEIYKQLRVRLDDNMREYNSRKETGDTRLS
jgi:hypothetical protein